VVPYIRQRLPESTAIVLGKAVLWLVFSSVACDFVAEEYRDCVKRDTGMVTIVDGQNPILKVPIIVSGNQGIVLIDEIPRPPDNVDGTMTASGDNDGGERQRQQGGRISDERGRDSVRYYSTEYANPKKPSCWWRCTANLDVTVAKWLYKFEA
jgi:hypothetical protein